MGVIDHANGAKGLMPLYVAQPDGHGAHSGVVMIHDALGMSTDLRNQVDWLASSGFVAAGTDLYHWGRRLRCVVSVIGDAMRGSGDAFADLDTVRRWLIAHPACTGSIGVVGFCMGGGFAILLAPTGRYEAASVNYGGLPKDVETRLRGAGATVVGADVVLVVLFVVVALARTEVLVLVEVDAVEVVVGSTRSVPSDVAGSLAPAHAVASAAHTSSAPAHCGYERCMSSPEWRVGETAADRAAHISAESATLLNPSGSSYRPSTHMVSPQAEPSTRQRSTGASTKSPLDIDCSPRRLTPHIAALRIGPAPKTSRRITPGPA